MDTQTDNSHKAQANMIEQQLRTSGVLNDVVLNVMADVPRQLFVPEAFKEVAYCSGRIPLNHNQVMLLPEEQGRLLQALALKPTDNVCEIGTGSSYLTALLAKSCQRVVSFDLFLDFAELAKEKLATLGINNVSVITDDANQHWESQAPYDVICVTASMPLYPEQMKKGLTVGGRLFAIVGTGYDMKAMLITRTAEETWSEKVLFDTDVPAMLNATSPDAFIF
jgi:protein-L-isoaspartate(D-aspartate) O-methyltransferase